MTVRRYEGIRRRLEEGRSLREIASALGCSRRTVREVRDGSVARLSGSRRDRTVMEVAAGLASIIHELGLGHPLKFLWERRRST